jgi:hypothetical protein
VRTLAVLVLALPLASCATLADAAKGDQNLPNAGQGPFRALKKGELGLTLVAPNVVDDNVSLARDASVIDADDDPSTFEVVGYFAASGGGSGPEDPPVAIRRGTAADGRSFPLDKPIVLEVTETWEKGSIGAPSALRVGKGVWLYYGTNGGIGLAKSDDGTAFTKAPGPVLETAASGWDQGALPRSPSVIQLADGSFSMFYEVLLPDGRRVIGEASSPDGASWTRVGNGPALEPAAPSDEAYDDAGTFAPCAVPGTSEEGRPLLRLYYGAESGAGARTIGLASRFPGEAFQRGASPVFGAGTSRAPTEPAVVFFDGVAFLFATQNKSGTAKTPAVAAGVAPAQATLPAPTSQ